MTTSHTGPTMKGMGIRHSLLLAVALSLVSNGSLSAGQRSSSSSAETLMGQALHQQEVEGNLEAAIATLHRVVADPQAPRAVKASALVRIGRCYEQLGRTEARKAYEQVLTGFADQPDAVAFARARLGPKVASGPASSVSTGRVWTMPADSLVVGPVSHDGRYVPYLTGTNLTDLAFLVHDLESGNDRRVSPPIRDTTVPLWAVVSRDGKRIAGMIANLKTETVQVQVTDLAGTGASAHRVLFAEPRTHIYPADWSPDGSSIAVGLETEDSADYRIGVLSTSDGKLRVLKTLDGVDGAGLSVFSSPLFDFTPFVPLAFSPDGQFIAFDRPKSKGGTRDVFLLAVDSGAELPIVTTSSDDALVGWSPDGSQIVFATERAGAVDLMAVQVTGGKPQGSPRVLQPDVGNPARVALLGLSDAGALHTMVCGDCLSDLRISDLDPQTGRLVGSPMPVEAVVSGGQAAWSHDGQSLAYLSRRGRIGTRDVTVLAIRSTATGAARELLPNLGALRNPFWSRDASYLVVQGSDLQGTEGLYRIDSRTGDVSVIDTVKKGESVNAPQWSNDGARIYYRVDTSAGFAYRERDLASGRVREVLSQGEPFAPLLLPPARQTLVLNRKDTPTGTWVTELLPIAGGPARALFKVPAGQQLLGAPFASADGRRVAIVADDPSAQIVRVMVVSTEDGQARELLRGLRPQQLPAVWWLPDGTSLLYRRTVAGGRNELWWVPVDGGTAHVLGLADNSILTRTGLRPDGRQIVYEVPAPFTGREVWSTRSLLSPVPATAGRGRQP